MEMKKAISGEQDARPESWLTYYRGRVSEWQAFPSPGRLFK